MYRFLILILFLISCNSRFLTPDRTQFIKDGTAVPTIELTAYKSVQQRNHQDAGLAVAVAISGGGHRSANFAMGVLLGLEEIELNSGRNALKEIDYLSTVSGGGFAGGAFISALYDHEYFSDKTTDFSLEHYFDDCAKGCLKKSYAGVLAKANINPVLWFSYVDDGDALEKAIDDYVCGSKFRKSLAPADKRTIRLGDLFIDKNNQKAEVLFPMMIANGSLLDKMAIFPFTPDILEQYKIVGYTHRLKKRENKNLDSYEMPLSVGIKASGSFPVLISNTTLKSAYHSERKYLHIIDGAMTDNIGYGTAMDLLNQDSTVDRKALLVIDADNVGNRPTFSKKQNAQFSLKVFGKLASSGLDARRITLEKDISLIAEQLNIEAVFLGFNGFLKGNHAKVPEKIKVKTEQERLLGLMIEETPLTDLDRQILYELLTKVATKYSITKMEQNLLVASGREIVKMNEALIKKAMEPAY